MNKLVEAERVVSQTKDLVGVYLFIFLFVIIINAFVALD
jgi:hypothetical protein